LGATGIKAAQKYVGEIEPRNVEGNKFGFPLSTSID